LEHALLSLQQAGQKLKTYHAIHLQLTLVDNSVDDSYHYDLKMWLEKIEGQMPDWTVRLHRASGNLGYGRGNNVVIEQSESDYHLVINPDLFVETNMLVEAFHFMQAHPDVGLLVPAVFGEDGMRQYLCKRNPTLLIMFLRSFDHNWIKPLFRPVLERFEMRDCDYEEIIEGVQYPTGCCMFFRTQALQQIKGFDPDYFLHYEDADIGRRLSMVARIVYVPNVRVIHRWARETHISWRMRLITVRSGLIYWRKWGGMFCAGTERAYVRSDIKQTEQVRTGVARKVLVTGATGFVGRGLCERLVQDGYKVRGAVRQLLCPGLSSNVERVAVGSLDKHIEWSSVLSGVEFVVHLAARVHVMRELIEDPLAEFRKINVVATTNLARQAALAGVKRFVFISSVKVNGESTPADHLFTAEDVPAPVDSYGIAKCEAEAALKKIAEETGMELVIIRPVLVYGPGVRGNFMELISWLEKGFPSPLGAIHNKRSLVALGNLVDFVMTCLKHPKAANQTFLVSDGVDLSTPELLKMTMSAMNKNVQLIPVPLGVLKWVGQLLGKKAYIGRLSESLRVDISKNHELVGWIPPVSVEKAMKETILHYFANYDR
jgi:nucleoside-diphosphate-sugar epimerase/GT2 family glycosyltransferase